MAQRTAGAHYYLTVNSPATNTTHSLRYDDSNVKKFANIALWCARSPMGANIALLRYLYDVSFDMKLHG